MSIQAGTFKFDLVCGEEWKISFVSTVYLLGVFFGAPLSGLLSDKYVIRQS